MRVPLLSVSAALGLAFLLPSGMAAAAELPDHPLTLEDCISLGRQLNPSLAIARESVLSAEASLQRSLSSYYPSASFVAIQGRTGGSSFVETPAGTIAFATSDIRRESEVMLRQVLWETGRKESVKQDVHALAASRAGEEGSRQDLVWAVSQGYYQALAAEELVEVARATLAASRDHEKLVKARAEVGMAAPVDLIPAEATSAEAEFTLLQTENAADLAKARLKNTIGLPASYRLRLARPEPGPSEGGVPPFEEALSLALEQRPEIIALGESIAGTEYGVRLAEATENAVLSVSAQYERGITGPREGESWSVIASVTAFLFDGGIRDANVAAARSRLRSLRAQEQDRKSVV